MNEVSDRILKRLNELKITQKELAKAVGASSPTVNNWLNYDREPSIKYLEKLANTLEVSIQWLVTGYELENSFLADNIKIRKAPILSFHEVVDFSKHLTINDTKRNFEYFVDNKFSDEMFWLKVESDSSMFPIFRANDLVLVDTRREPRTGNCVVAVIDGDAKAILRKYRICYDEKANKEYFQLVAENDFYPALDSRHSRFFVKGVVVKLERNLV